MRLSFLGNLSSRRILGILFSGGEKFSWKNCVFRRHLSVTRRPPRESKGCSSNNHIFRLLYDYPPSSKTDLSIPSTRCSIERPSSFEQTRAMCTWQMHRQRCNLRDHSSWRRWFDPFFFSLLSTRLKPVSEKFSQNCESNCKLRKRVVELLEITSYVERWSFRWVWVSRVKLLREEEDRENLKVGSSPLRCDNFIYTLAFDQLSLSPVIYASSRKYESRKKEKKKIKFSRNWDTLPLVVSPYSNFTQRDTTPPL